MASIKVMLGLATVFVISSLAQGEILFSTLPKTLQVTASASNSKKVLKAGVDNITLTWGLISQTPKVDDSSYKTVKLKLCYPPISQQDRPWRKTEDHLNKDKSCQHAIVTKPYAPSNNKFTWLIERNVPTATYFVRAYVLDDKKHEVGYGQTTDPKQTTNLFQIQAITGRHVSIDIAAAAFSTFSIVSLAYFFYVEKKKAKKAT